VTSGESVAGCACMPLWPDLVVHTEIGDITVEPAGILGGLAYHCQAWCAACGAAYPGPFWVPPRLHQSGLPRRSEHEDLAPVVAATHPTEPAAEHVPPRQAVVTTRRARLRRGSVRAGCCQGDPEFPGAAGLG
jgi:hypothetical protein